MTLTEFLNARLDEDEKHWRNAMEEGTRADTPWRTDRDGRELKAKRAILADIVPELKRWAGFVEGEYNSYPDYDDQDMLKILAAVYSDHPDYDESWSL